MHARLYETMISAPPGAAAGASGVDAGLTLTKIARAEGGALRLFAMPTSEWMNRDALEGDDSGGRAGVTGARASNVSISGAIVSQEIDAAVRGIRAMMDVEGDFMLVLLGTGTAFAAVRGERVTHLGGTPLGGGSFAGIARAVHPTLTYGAMIAAAARGDRSRADIMVADAYPDGIGRIGPAMTAAHLSKAGASLDDFLAGLLNLHGEGIAQIGAQRALLQQVKRLVLCGGFVHENARLAESITFMSNLFGVKVDVAPQPGFAGAIGAMMLAGGSGA